MPLANTSRSPTESPLAPRSTVVSPTGRSTTFSCSPARTGKAKSIAAGAATRTIVIFMGSPRVVLLNESMIASRGALYVEARGDHLDQRRPAFLERVTYGRRERGRIVHSATLRPKGPGERDEVGVARDHAELRYVRGHHVVANLTQRGVVPHHDGQAQALFDRRHEFGDRELQPEVARERDHRPGGARDLGAESGRQREPQGAVAGRMEPLARILDRVGEVSPIRDLRHVAEHHAENPGSAPLMARRALPMARVLESALSARAARIFAAPPKAVLHPECAGGRSANDRLMPASAARASDQRHTSAEY